MTLSRRLSVCLVVYLSVYLVVYLPLNCFSANLRRIGRSILFFNLSYCAALITGKTAPSSFAYPPSYTFKTYKTHRFNLFQKIQ